MILKIKTFSRFSFTRALFICLLAPIFFLGMRTYYLHNKIQECQTSREAVNFMIKHKTTFLMLYKFRLFQDGIKAHFHEPPVKSYYDALSDWVEVRIMDHIEQHDDVAEVADLPWIERNAIRALDASSYVGDVYQRCMYYVTGASRSP